KVSDGKLTALSDGGTDGYNYSISHGATANSDGVFGGLSANDYTVTVTDAHNCTTISPEVNIINPDTLVFSSIDSTAVSCHNSSDGSITAAAAGGTSPYTYTLNGGSSNSTGKFGNLTAGSYTVAVIDAKGCQASRPAVHVLNPDKVVLTLTDSSSVKCYGNSDAKLQAAAAGGSSPYRFTMSGDTASNTNGLFSNLPVGSYRINVADANGCRDSVSKTLVQPAQLGVTLVKDNDITCHNAGDGRITASATGGTTPYSYALAPGTVKNTDGIFGGLNDNYYMVIVTDANNCFAVNDKAVHVVNPDPVSVASLDTTAITCHNAADGIIKTAAAGGTAPYVYKLNNGQANTDGQFTNLTEGKFTVTITDANNCPGVQTRTITFTNPDSVSIVSVDSTNVTCQNGPGSITVVARGGTSPLTYSTGGISNHDGKFTNMTAGTYTVTVTDSNNCPQAVSKPVNVVDQTIIQNFNIIEKSVIK
ncbi:MAG: SprB repeat-containing protein, partial [Bacteroidota bacterium]|nr:SprB repeat-containing protein [Bacteroidota bacterium]